MTKEQQSSLSLEMADSSGIIEIKNVHAPRLGDLAGKTICELSNVLWEASRTFPALRQTLQNRFAGIKIIPYNEFPRVYHFELDDVSKLLKERGCDGVIVGNAA